jgi:ribosomal protein L11 methyltransferase
MKPRQWYVMEVSAAPHVREAIEYGLMEAGAVGTETDDTGEDLKITGYFEAPFDQKRIEKILIDALRIYLFTPDQRLRSSVRQIGERDWLAEWKKHWRPVEVGRFIIAPPWIESEPEPTATGPSPARGADKIVIRINPGMAFGTGTHETTRLCLKAIEKHFRGGSFLDVGTGTGILAIAAAKMFPAARTNACDTDPEAIEIAKDNARLNNVADQIEFRTGSVNEQTASADLVCANLTAPVIGELLPQLLAATCGRLILSGILDSQAEQVQSRLIDLGATTLESDQDGDWVSLVV